MRYQFCYRAETIFTPGDQGNAVTTVRSHGDVSADARRSAGSTAVKAGLRFGKADDLMLSFECCSSALLKFLGLVGRISRIMVVHHLPYLGDKLR